MRNSGFTYIEMLMVLSVTLVIAAIAMPNLIADKSSRELWQFKKQLAACGLQAQNRAIEFGDRVSLVYTKSPSQFQVVEEAANGQRLVATTLDLPDSVKASKFVADKDQAAVDNWRVPFFADGTSSGGGVEFDVAGSTFYLAVDRSTGLTRIGDGPLPNLSLDRWSAGGYEPRT